jgi:hypothetical protein
MDKKSQTEKLWNHLPTAYVLKKDTWKLDVVLTKPGKKSERDLLISAFDDHLLLYKVVFKSLLFIF